MRDCLILGTGRSGSSMLGGVLAGAGYFMGDDLYEHRISNPKGFFEDREINSINEEILSLALPSAPPGPLRRLFPSRPVFFQRWLLPIPDKARLRDDDTIRARIRTAVSKDPFCYKDPRFSYTLPVWRPFLPQDCLYVVTFRAPEVTVASMLKEAQEASYLRHLRVTPDRLFSLWFSSYRRILEEYSSEGDWLFLHYDQIVSGSARSIVNDALHLDSANWEFPQQGISRSSSVSVIVPESRSTDLYKRLCSIANYAP